MEVAKERGWEVYGIEYSKTTYDSCIAKGLNVHFGSIENFDSEPGTFDVIVSFEVIEHLTEPMPFISQSYDLLRRGGIMYLSTPNFNSYLRYRLQDKYDVIDYPNHLSYFSVKTLKKAFTSVGFETLNVQTTGISITRAKTSRGESRQEFVSETSDDEMLRYRIEKSGTLRLGKKITNNFLSSLRIGHNMKGTFLKPGS